MRLIVRRCVPGASLRVTGVLPTGFPLTWTEAPAGDDFTVNGRVAAGFAGTAEGAWAGFGAGLTAVFGAGAVAVFGREPAALRRTVSEAGAPFFTVTVRVTKLHPPLQGAVQGTVAVEITRERA